MPSLCIKFHGPLMKDFSMKCTTKHLLSVKYRDFCTLAERPLENQYTVQRYQYELKMNN